MKQCASVRALQELKDVTPEIAEKVRDAWAHLTRDELLAQHDKVAEYARLCLNPPGTRHLRRMAIDSLIGTHGVEYLGTSRRTGSDVYYCNTGDAYDLTIIFSGACLRLGCWGDLIERGSIRERQS